MFSLENEKTKDYFFFGHTKQKLKTIEVVFITRKGVLDFDTVRDAKVQKGLVELEL